MQFTGAELSRRFDVSRVAVSKWNLKKNPKGKIDLSKNHNYDFLLDKFGLKRMIQAFPEIARHKTPEQEAQLKQNIKEKADKKKEERTKKAESRVKKVEKVEKSVNNKTSFELNAIKLQEEIKGKRIQNEIKTLQLEEEKGNLFNANLVKNTIFDSLGVIAQAIGSTPYSIVDELISIVQTDPDGARERVIKKLIKEYSSAMNRAVDEAEKIFKENVK